MICAIDVGNSSLKAGLFDRGVLQETFRISIEEGEASAAEAVARKIRAAGVDYLGMSSVVPTVSDAIQGAVEAEGGVSVFALTYMAALPFDLRYETPETMGVDRIAAAAGAWEGFGGTSERPIVVVDAGTAVTADVIVDGAFLGGLIIPGPELQRRAVRSGTAQLPVVDLAWPARVISRSTREAVTSGIMFSFVDGIRGILVRIIDELGQQPRVVVTGGWGKLLSTKIPQVNLHDPDLVLRGIAALMELNRGDRDGD